ncbi:Protein CBG00582 [Caenorhabditis briggsae]|uniref:Protein CBG00582 n=1 Tax=Caenorhabditis briggsae TaxID=6238 RepID=A8WNJ1_CAEBR|nr:Protein CBG00582 [Caenorhabditis briggsae]CAP22046.2 Protein CBG00582 [Caenorhabditis briggsae]
MTSEGKPVPSVTKRLLNSGSQLPSFRRNGIFYVLLALFLYIIVVTRPQQTMVLSRMMEVPQIQRIPSNDYQEISKVEVKSKKLEQKPDWDTLDGIGFEFEEMNTKFSETRLYAPEHKFFGADPIIEPNRQLYTAFGKYFPFAIGKKPGFTKFRVLPNQNQKTRKYEFQDVTTIPFTYFLWDILGLKQIDIAWIDIEGGEFEFLDQFYRGGPMDEKGIVICQFNLEVHSKFNPPGAQVFHDFVFRILDDKRYIFTKVLNTDVGIHRMFFVNVEDMRCV